MELFNRLFGSLLVFVYHCFDRVVINGYLFGLSRPEQLSYFYRNVLGIEPITKEVLAQRTQEYQRWVESYARNHTIPFEWAEKGVRKEDYALPLLNKMKRNNGHGVYLILKSMEQGQTFRCAVPKYPTADSNYRILRKQRSRFTHYYFYIHDVVLGPMVMRAASFLPFQTTYYLNGHNFIEKELEKESIGITFHKNDNAFLATSDPEALQAASDRFTHEVIRKRIEHWTIILAPKFSERERKAINLQRYYAISQIEFCWNFIFRRNFPIHKIFERSCELGLWKFTVDKISEVFGVRLTKKLRGKLQTTLEKIEHGHHIFRAYFKNAFLKQYEKFSTFLRIELCSNNLSDFRLMKGLDNLPKIREAFMVITDRFITAQAQNFNVHVDFPLFQRLALPIQVGKTKIPGIKIQNTRMIRLMEVLLHYASEANGWTAAQIHSLILKTFNLSEGYTITQMRYDLRKMKAHGLLERHDRRYSYRLTEKGRKVALMFVLFHKNLCGPIANSLFHHRPDPSLRPDSKLEAAYHKADDALQRIINILEAA
jgi:hypothetical protein